MEKSFNFGIIGLVALVAIVGLVVLFSTNTPTLSSDSAVYANENVAGQAITKGTGNPIGTPTNCVDTDNGAVYTVYGETYTEGLGTKKHQDYCIENTVVEGVCTSTGAISISKKDCSELGPNYICNLGACENSVPPTCYDSDGDDPENPGWVQYGDQDIPDRCLSEFMLEEQLCGVDGLPAEAVYDCDSPCQNSGKVGFCPVDNPSSTCNDTDGSDEFELGYIYVDGALEYTDTCLSGYVVNEGICTVDGDFELSQIACTGTDVCENGVCVDTYVPPSETCDGTGNGRYYNPYEIYDCQDLQNIQTLTVPAPNQLHVELCAPIDCSDTVNWNGGDGFEAVVKDFKMYGNGLEISNLYTTDSSFFKAQIYQGVHKPVLRNVVFRNPTIDYVEFKDFRYTYSQPRSYHGGLMDVGEAIKVGVINPDFRFEIGDTLDNDNARPIFAVGGIVGSYYPFAQEGGSRVEDSYVVGGNIEIYENPDYFSFRTTLSAISGRDYYSGNTGAYVAYLTAKRSYATTQLIRSENDYAPQLYMLGETNPVPSNVEYLYYLEQEEVDPNGVPLTTQELRDENNFEGFDFDEVWAINSEINGGMPYLQLEVNPQ